MRYFGGLYFQDFKDEIFSAGFGCTLLLYITFMLFILANMAKRIFFLIWTNLQNCVFSIILSNIHPCFNAVNVLPKVACFRTLPVDCRPAPSTQAPTKKFVDVCLICDLLGAELYSTLA